MTPPRPGPIPLNPWALRRFWLNVDTTGTCWTWTGHNKVTGYGLLSIDGVLWLAHRVAYEWFVGIIPEGLEIDHLCNVRGCVNPAHLEVVTREENMARVAPRRTHCRNGHALTADNVWERRDGGHGCLICRRAGGRRYYHAQKARVA